MSSEAFDPLYLKSPNLLLERLGIDQPEEIQMEAIAQACGATIVYEPLQGCEARIVGSRNRAIITVNSTASKPRQRFSAAHELGHWMHDRGKVAFACAEKQFVGEWGQHNPERRANRFAADLLLPRTIFKRRARHRDMTFQVVRELAAEFQTSLTATAIRLVELGSFPAMIVCSDARKRRWFALSPLVPDTLAPLSMLHPESVAAQIIQGRASARGPVAVPAHFWTATAEPERTFKVLEDSVPVGQGMTLSLIWWKDESQVVAAAEKKSEVDCPKIH